MFSVLLRPALTPADAGLLSLLAGAAMAEAASETSASPVRCKWPNDLLNGAGGKVGGILLESVVMDGTLREVVMGLGVNLSPPPDVEGAAGLGEDVDPIGLLTGFLQRFRAGYRPQDPSFGTEIVRRWSAISATLGRDVEVVRGDGSRAHGRASGLDAHGGLIMETATGSTTVVFGEVAHLT